MALRRWNEAGRRWNDPGARWDALDSGDGGGEGGFASRGTLLPPSASAQERVLEDATARLGAVPAPLRALWRPAECPAALIPWLAWTLSVDEWDPAWPEALQRQMIAESAMLHARKGTPWAVKRALQLMGYGNVAIVEGSAYRRDATYDHDGEIDHGGDLGPYQFDVVLNIGALPDGAAQAEIRRRVGYYKNARSHLRRIVAYGVYHDGVYSYDGSITYAGGFVTVEED